MTIATIYNLISKEEVEKLIAHFKTYDGHISAIDSNNNFHWGSGDLELESLNDYPDIKKIVKYILDKTEAEFRNNYKIEGTLGFKRIFAQTLKPGAFTHAHNDDDDVNYDGKFKNEKHYSALLMLNDNFGGGELYFKHKDIELKTPPGSLIYFRGNEENLHGVREVTSGERINMVIFFRDYDIVVD